ncbi:hypothetical protein Tco_0539438 [Tanacetum coccineum]
MDDPNITTEEYIRLEEEKAQKRGKVFNWETAKYGKIWVSSVKTLSCEPTICSLNDEIDFRVSFDDSDDEDYTVIFDKNSFSYKSISTNDLKMDLKNDNEKVNLPSSPKPTVSCFDDLDFFKDFENEFPAIVYNDAQTSKSDLLTEYILSPQHIDEFDLNDKTSLSEYDEEEQNVLTKCLKFCNLCAVLVDFTDMALPPRDQRHQYLRVQAFNFRGLPYLMAEGLSARMLMEHRDAQGQSMFTSRAWRRLFDIRGPLVHELILEFFSTFRFEEAILDLDTAGALQFQLGGIPDKGDLRDYWIGILFAGDFLSTAPSYTAIHDPILRLCHRLIACSIVGRSQALEKVIVTNLFYLRGMDVGSVNVPYLLARYLRLFATERKIRAYISGGQFVARLAEHFGLLIVKILQGLTVIAPELQIIDMAELVRLHICMEVDDT